MTTVATNPEAPAIDRWQRIAAIAGAVGLGLCAVGWFVAPDQCFRSYLWAYCFFVGIALGSLVLVMLQFLTGGAWGLVIRGILLAATRTLPALALLYLPIAFGFIIPVRPSGGEPRPAISGVYLWADPAFVNEITHESHEQALKYEYYLNWKFFLVRAAICFGVWIAVATYVNRWSAAMDRPDVGDREPRQLRMVSAAGLVLYGFTVTVMAIDWIMSLEPRWVSSIFGVLIGVGQVLNALSFAVVVLVLVADHGALTQPRPLSAVVDRRILRDLGSLMLTFVMVWAYMSFSQLLLIWAGDLPSETPYYLRRTQGGWQVFAIALALLHFALPFVLLLMSSVKTHRRTLIRVAILVLAMRAVDLYWVIMPAQPGQDGLGAVQFVPGWTDLPAAAAIGGIWLATFLGQLRRRPLLPTYDPRLAETVPHA